MIELRPFLNKDSPGIAAVWSDQPPLRGRAHPLTASMLEQHVLARPNFDPSGLLVADDSGRIAGFVHVGFKLGLQPGELDQATGVICQLVVTPCHDAGEIAGRLLHAGENWLRNSGAKELLGGGYGVHAPFYLGLYGGCRLPGVLAGDTVMMDALRAAGYSEYRKISIWQLALEKFRPPVDRELMALRRQFRLKPASDDLLSNWREACTYSWIDRVQFRVVSASTEEHCASLTFWNMEPLATNWGQRAMGLSEVTGKKSALSAIELTCFLADAMRLLQSQGERLIEVQTEAADESLLEACRKLALREVDQGIQFQKQTSGPPS